MTREERVTLAVLAKSSPTTGPHDLEKQVMTLLRAGSPVESPIIVKDATLVTPIPRSTRVWMPARRTSVVFWRFLADMVLAA
jgi:hypothetical protein